MKGSIKSIPRFWIVSYALTFLLPMVLLCFSFLSSDKYWEKDVRNFYLRAAAYHAEKSDDLFRKIEMLELELGWDKRSTMLSHSSRLGPEEYYEALSLKGFINNSLVSRPFLKELLLYFPDQEKILTKNGLYDKEEFIRLFPSAAQSRAREFLSRSLSGSTSRGLYRLPEQDALSSLVMIRRFPLNSASGPKIAVISILDRVYWEESFRTLFPGRNNGGDFHRTGEEDGLIHFAGTSPRRKTQEVRIPSSVLKGEYRYAFPPPGEYGNYRLARIVGLAAMLICLVGGSVFTVYSVRMNLRQIKPIYKLLSSETSSPQVLKNRVEGILDRNRMMAGRLEKVRLLQMICGSDVESRDGSLARLLPHESHLICHWKGEETPSIPSPEKGIILEWPRFRGDESLLLWNGPSDEETGVKTLLENTFRQEGIPAGCSHSVGELKDLKDALEQAGEASEYSRLNGTAGLMVYASESGTQRLPEGKGTLKLVNIRRHIKSCEWSAARREISSYMTELKDPGISAAMIRIQAYALLSALADGLGRLRSTDAAGLAERIDGLTRDFEASGRLSAMEESVIALLEELETQTTEEDGASGPWTSQVSDYLEEHYGDSGLSVQGMAEELSTTASYLSSVFRRENDTGLLGFIHRFRLRKSLPLINDKSNSIRESAEAVGFMGSNAYIRSFKKYLGITPGGFRALSDDEKWAIIEKMEDSRTRRG